MKIIQVLFATVILRTVLADKLETIDSRNVESVEVGNNAKDEESELTYVKSVIPNKNAYQAKVGILRTDDETSEVSKSINDDDLEEKDNEESNAHKTGITDTTNESSISSESDSYELSQEFEKSVFDYLTKMIHESKDGESRNINRRLDIEENGDDFAELVDIDDLRSNDYNQDANVNFLSNRALSNYGISLDKKGRSGIPDGIRDPSSSTVINRDRLLFRPAVSRHGLFINPGYFQIATPPPLLSFTKIESRDNLHQKNRLNRFPFRWVQGTDKVVLDVNANAYQYEPEENGPETQIKPWNQWRI